LEETKKINKSKCPLTSYQRDIWLDQKFSPDKPIYNIGGYWDIKGRVNYKTLEKSINMVINNNDGLRVVINEYNGIPYQSIKSKVDYKLPYKDFSKEKNPLDFSLNWIINKFNEVFNFDSILFELSFIKIDDNQYLLYEKFHHSVIDAFGGALFYDETIDTYNRLINNELYQLSKENCNYIDSIKENEKYLNSKKYEEDLEFWKEKYQEIPDSLFDKNHVVDKGYTERLNLKRNLYTEIEDLCSKENISVFHFMLAVVATYFSKIQQKEEMIIDVPINNRTKDYKMTIGLFANEIPLKIKIDKDSTFIELAKKIKNELRKCYRHVKTSSFDMYRTLNVDKERSLADISLSFDNSYCGNSLINTNTNFIVLWPNYKNVPLTLYIADTNPNEDVKLDFYYQENLFKDIVPVGNLLHQFEYLFNVLATNYQKKITEIQVLPQKEICKLLYEFNNTNKEYIDEKTIHELFEEQVEKTPDRIAAVYKHNKITYSELNRKSNQLARVLRDRGVKLDDLVGVMLSNSLELLIGVLAVLKAGAAYLPLDLELPEKRIEYIINDSQIKMLVTKKELLKSDFNYKGNVTYVKEGIDELDVNLAKVTKPNNLIYAIYTSGTTGNPKGALLEHRNLVNLINCTYIKSKINFESKVLQFASMSFDVCYQEIFSTLLSGGELHILDQKLKKDVSQTLNYAKENKIEILFLPTAYLKLIGSSRDHLEKLPSNVNRIITAGEQLIISKDLNDYCTKKQISISNHYGPSETHVVTTYDMDYGDQMPSIPFIGKPINNNKIYIIDENENLQPIGVKGELCITGMSVGRGYLNREELTKEKFVNNPFGKGKMYKTGDLARWMPNGNIEYLGRIDNQVKIRGYRVELGAIESKVLNYKYIKEAVVLAKQDFTNKYLIAYVVSQKKLSITELRKYLSNELPDYMIPSYFMQLDKMPLNKNGKIDRKALPEFDGNMNIEEDYVEARNEIELKLVRLWEEILKVDGIGINDNFFDLGGHSLKAIELVSKIHRELNVELEIRKVFELKNIKNIAREINKMEESSYSKIEAVEKREYYPVSSAQKRLLLLDQIEEDNINYNIPGAIKIKGNFNEDLLLDVFKQLLNRHESLRTSFEFVEGEPVQKIHDYKELDFKAEVIKEKEGEEQEIMKGFIRPFDLNKAPLIRVGLIEKSDEEYILLLDMHHIISDGVSINILFKEITELYQGKELQELEIQYKDFAIWQNELFKSSDMDKQRKYWLDRFQDEIPVLDLPTDYPRPKVQNFEGDRIEFELSEDSVKSLKDLCKKTNTTLYMALLAVYNVLLSKYSGQEDIIIGSPIAGRRHADLENIVGMFVNTLAIRNYPKGEKNFIEFLDEVRENTLNAYENQDYQFEELVDKLKLRRDLSRNPLFDVMFTMQNMGNQKMELDNLELKDYNMEFDISKFDMTLSAKEEGSKIRLQLEYATRLFKKESIERFITHFIKVMEDVLSRRDVKLSEIEIITEEEKEEILYKFNDTRIDYPRNKTIHKLFEEQAERTPNNIAVVFKDKELTYKELNERANQLARVLREKGVKEETIVGIMVERSLEMIIGIMAILKAGGAYLPIDPNYPMNRINYMLDECNVGILLLTENLNDLIKDKKELIYLNNKELYKGDNNNLVNINKFSDLAYIIYTSGSTGKPKGTMVEHRNVIRLVINPNYINFKEDDRILQTGSLAFDASTFEIWGALLNGLSVCLLNKDVILNGYNLEKVIKEYKISILWLSSPLFNQLAQQNETTFMNLRYLLVGGDALSPNHINRVKKKNKNLNIVNGYGPTENTTFSTYHLINREYKGNIPIGKPISNSTVYIVDKNGKLQPIGVYGELWTGGDGVSRGYLNRPELTKEKFIKNPYKENDIVYKTGDLVRWLSDGSIEFKGRVDNQVKIRGFRIELLEIEYQLIKYVDIKESVVVVKQDSNAVKYLCAYFVSDIKLDALTIRNYLLEKLPDYMIPSYFIQLKELPLNQNGKIDRKLLPEPNGLLNTGVIYIAPSNEVEKTLVELLKNVLRVEKIGVYDNFFELGGDSLRAISLLSSIYRLFKIDIPLTKLFKENIKEISRYIINKNLNREIFIEEDYILLNEKKNNNIFTFPPITANPMTYKSLSVYLKTHSIYSFKFINDEKRIERYVNEIISVQENGPYILMGYSAGGNLAYEVAKKLEQMGYTVSHIIMIDSYRRQGQMIKPEELNKESIKELVIRMLDKSYELNKNVLDINLITDKLYENAEEYSKYISSLCQNEKINAKIHFIKNGDENIKIDITKEMMWEEVTNYKVEEYKGVGSHVDMLVKIEYLSKNAEILRKILENL